MDRIESIIENSRIVLADVDKTRYTDTVLLKYLNDGISDFVLNTKILKQRLFLELSPDIATYDLSDHVLEFLRFQFGSKAIPVKSQEELDQLDKDWQDRVDSKVICISLSDMKKGVFRTYPRIDVGLNIIQQNSFFGGLIDVIINDDSLPITTTLESGANNYLIIFAVVKPKKVTLLTLDTELEIGSEYDMAMEYYIIARALRSDNDAMNRNFGSENLQLYNNYVNEASLSNSIGNQSVGDRIINYRGGIK